MKAKKEEQVTPMRKEIVDTVIADLMDNPETKAAWLALSNPVRNRLRVKWLNISQQALDTVRMFG